LKKIITTWPCWQEGIVGGHLSRDMKKDTAITMSYLLRRSIFYDHHDKMTLRDFYANMASYHTENKNYPKALADLKKIFFIKTVSSQKKHSLLLLK